MKQQGTIVLSLFHYLSLGNKKEALHSFHCEAILVKTETNTFLGQVTDETKPGSLSLRVAAKQVM